MLSSSSRKPSAAGSASGAEPPDRRVNDVDYLTSEEVMKVLSIKKASLYTYVSRGLVRTIKQPGQKKANLYLKADVDALRTRVGDGAGGSTISHSLRYGDPVVQSWICDITRAGPRYRGHLALDLVKQRRSFEYVAELIWGGLPRLRDSAWPLEPGVTAGDGLARAAGAAGQSHESVARLLARTALAMSSLERPSSETAYLGRSAGIRLIQAFAAIAGCLGPRGLWEPARDQEHVAALLLRGFGATADDPSALDAINAALVLNADHELSAPTFVARICASTGVDLYACVVAALMAHCGPMQMGGAADLEDLLLAGDIAPLAASQDAPCFGHPLYTTDPRAEALLAVTARCASVTASGRRLLEAIETMRAETDRYPNLFGALVVMVRALGLPPGAASLVNAVGRTAGWIAHAVEQRHAGAMLRPRARYMGEQGPSASY